MTTRNRRAPARFAGRRSALATAVAGVLSAPAPMTVAAEGMDAMMEEIVVTGSRIRRTDLNAVSPVTMLNEQEFTISGIMNVEQKLAELPQTLPSFGPSSNNPGDGTARVDLRGLGSFRTLVLVNGRRYIPATQTQIVDLNSIPTSLIQSVDIVTGGASAVYGSEAISGVVNFTLKDDFEGVEFNALYDVTGEGDAERLNADMTIGGNFADGRGNAVLYAQYSEREPLFQGERQFSEVALTESDGRLVPGGSSGIPSTRLFGGPTVNPGSPDEFTLGRFNPDGSGAPFVDPDDRFNYAPDNYLQLPQERFLAHAMGHYDLTDDVRAYMELTFAQNEVPQQLAPTPAFPSTVEVNPESPFFSADVQAALATLRELDPLGDGSNIGDTNGDGVIDGDDNVFLDLIGRRMVENGPRQAIDTRNAFRFMVGMEGDINDNWGFDVYALRSRLDNSQLLNNDVSASRFRQALVVTDDGTACQDPSGGCVPLNIWGAGNITPEAVDFVNVGATNVTFVQSTIYSGAVTGSLGNLIDQNNPVSVVVGAEYREEQSSFRPDTFLASGDVLGFNAGEPTVGSYDVSELFTEIDVPIASGMPGIEYLGIWGAFRYSDYSNIGGVESYAVTGTYAPVGAVSLRVGYQRATRAPNVFELFQGQANGFPTATDPCSSDGDNFAAIASLCEATGVPAGQTGVFEQANSQIEGTFGGNPDLSEEVSDTYTIGAVFQPEFLPGFDATIDYYSIEIEDAIDTLGGGVNNTLDLCYNQIGDLSSPYCRAISRRPDGNVNVVEVLNANIGKLETSGVDVNVNYSFPLDFGLMGNDSNVTIAYRSNFLLSYDETPVQDLPNTFECAGAFGNQCGDPRAEYTQFVRGTLDTGPLTLSVLWRYIGESEDDRVVNDGVAPSSLVVPSIDGINYVDLAGSYAFTDNFSVNVGIRNLFDTEPDPIGDVQEQANTFPELYDVIGRRFWLSGRYTF